MIFEWLQSPQACFSTFETVVIHPGSEMDRVR